MIAEDVHRGLVSQEGWEPENRTEIVINDTYDFVYGAATVLPYNIIWISPTQPVTGLGHYDDWLKNLLVHEYTHILDLGRVRDGPEILRWIIGRLYFPNMFAPTWVPEGYATYNETKHTNGGRGRDPYADMILRMAFIDGKVNTIDQFHAYLDSWPGGNISYVFGESIYSFISKEYGEAYTTEFSKSRSDDWIPYRVSRASKDVMGKKIQEIWEDWKRRSLSKYSKQVEVIKQKPLTISEQITRSGYNNSGPIWGRDGKQIYYYCQTPDRHISLRRVDLSSGSDEKIVDIHSEHAPFSLSPDGRYLVYSEVGFERSFSFYYDLWQLDIKTGKRKRLTKGLRARNPSCSPDGTKIVFVKNDRGKTQLTILNIVTSEMTPFTSDQDYTQYSEPSWSPDGNRVAVSVWKEGGYQDIWIYDVQTKSGAPIIKDRAWDISPSWTPDGRFVLFASDRSGVYNIYAFELSNHRLYQITNVVGGAFDPEVSPDGQKVAFVNYSSSGFDVHTIDLDREKWFKISSTVNPAISRNDSLFEYGYKNTVFEPIDIETIFYTANYPIHSYNPMPSMRPRFWLPFLAADEKGLGVSISTAGIDVLGKHFYSVWGQYGFASRRVGYNMTYINNQFYPTISVQASDIASLTDKKITDINGDEVPYWERLKRVSIATSIPYFTVRNRWTFSLGFEYEDKASLIEISPRVDNPYFEGTLNDVFLNVTFDNSHKYGRSISSTDGGRVSTTYRIFDGFWGSDVSFNEFVADARGYLGMPFNGHVFAVRGAYGRSSQLSFQSDLFAVHGFPGLPEGKEQFLSSIEYRMPLFEIERGLWTWPIYFERAHLGFIYDYLSLRNNHNDEEVKASYGVAVRLDFVLGYLWQATLGVGFARHTHPDKEASIWVGINEVF